MSEEKLERIENQIGQVLQAVMVMQQDVSTLKQDVNAVQHDINSLKQDVNALKLDMTAMQLDMTAMKQNQNALREDLIALRHLVDSVEGTVKVAIADGFRSHDLYLDDMNADLAKNERQTRRLSRRVDQLERWEEN